MDANASPLNSQAIGTGGASGYSAVIQMFTQTAFFILTIVVLTMSANADPLKKIRLDVSATFARTEQQVKVEVGAVRGERLVEQTEVGAEIVATYNVFGHLAAGLYTQVDFGTRRAGRFNGFDSDGATTLTNESGGAYQELWIGPILRGHYKGAFAEVGYGLLTFRKDTGRDDLPSETGDTSSAFRTLPTVSWTFAIGGNVQVSEQLDVAARLIWRIRYYDRRGGAPLADNIVHGTQSYQPFVGVVWYPGRK